MNAPLTTLAPLTPDAIVQMATDRLTRMVARDIAAHGVNHDLVLRSCAAYERMHAEAVSVQQARTARDVAVVESDLETMLQATAQPQIVAPALLANARSERARLTGGAR